MLLVLMGCRNPLGSDGGDSESEDDVEPTTGVVEGRARLQSQDDHSGIVISLEASEDGMTPSVHAAVAGNKPTARTIVDQTTTAADGSYRVAEVKAGTYTIYASKADSQEKAVASSVTVTAGDTVTVEDLVLTQAGSISGTVTFDDQTDGNDGIVVFILGTSYIAMTDSDGNYEIGRVPSGGPYTLVAQKENAFQDEVELAEVKAGETVAAEDMAVYSKSGLAGRITVEVDAEQFYADGYDADEFEVRFLRLEDGTETYHTLELSEDRSVASGDFYYYPAGTYEVSAAVHHGWREAVKTDFHVWSDPVELAIKKDDEVTLEIDIPYFDESGVGTLALALDNSDFEDTGASNEFAGVWLESRDDESSYHFHIEREDSGSVLSGEYTHIKPGSYSVEALAYNDANVSWSGDWDWSRGARYSGEVTVNEETPASIDGSLTYVFDEHTRDAFHIADVGELNGLAWDGSNLWGADYTTNAIGKIDAAGNVITEHEVLVDGADPLPGGINGMTWDGTDLWVAVFADNGDQWIYKVDPETGDAASTDGFVVPDDATNTTAVAYDGTHLWHASTEDGGELRKLTTDGVLVETTSAGVPSPDGMTYHADHLWIIDVDFNDIVQVDPATGTIVDSYPVVPGTHSSLTHDGTRFWTYDQDDQDLYALTIDDGERGERPIFEDTFGSGRLDHDEWEVHYGTDDDEFFVTSDGELRAASNDNEIWSRRHFSGEFRLELDVRKEGTQDHSVWDFQVQAEEAWCDVTLLFDYDGVDQLILNDQPPVEIPADNPNEGRLIVTIGPHRVRAEFLATDGTVRMQSDAEIDPFGSTALGIYLAGIPGSPRYIDNVRVYELARPYDAGMGLNRFVDTGVSTEHRHAHYGLTLTDETVPTLLASNYSGNGVTEIDRSSAPDSYTATTTALSDVDHPHGIAYDSEDNTIWVCDTDGGRMRNYDRSDGSLNVGRDIEIGPYWDNQLVNAVVVDRTLYVGDRKKNGFWEIDISAQTPEIVHFRPLHMMNDGEYGYMDLVYDQPNNRLFLTSDEFGGFAVYYVDSGDIEYRTDHLPSGSGVALADDGTIYFNTGYDIFETNMDGEVYSVRLIPRPTSYWEPYVDLELVDGVFYSAALGPDAHVVTFTQP